EFRSATTPYLSRTMAFNRTLAHPEFILMPMDSVSGSNSCILERSAGIAETNETVMLSRFTFEALCSLGQRFGGIRLRRIYDWLARRAFPEPSHRWATDRYGLELYLSRIPT